MDTSRIGICGFGSVFTWETGLRCVAITEVSLAS